jgi:hypothetical protein
MPIKSNRKGKKGEPRPLWDYRWYRRNQGKLSDLARRDAIRAGRLRGSR